LGESSTRKERKVLSQGRKGSALLIWDEEKNEDAIPHQRLKRATKNRGEKKRGKLLCVQPVKGRPPNMMKIASGEKTGERGGKHDVGTNSSPKPEEEGGGKAGARAPLEQDKGGRKFTVEKVFPAYNWKMRRKCQGDPAIGTCLGTDQDQLRGGSRCSLERDLEL